MQDEVGKERGFKKVRIRSESQIYKTFNNNSGNSLARHETSNLTKISSPCWFGALLLLN